MAQLNHEPSMEDILASIKRIIAEDSEVAVPRSARPIRREMAAVPADPIVEAPAAPVAEAEFEPAPPEIDAAPEIEAVSETDAARDIAAVDAPEDAPAIEAEAETTDVLELTSPITEEVEPKPAPRAAQPKPIRQRPAQIASSEPEPIQTESTPAESLQSPREPVSIMDRLMSDTASEASRNAFAALTQLQVRADSGKENTLEGLVADLLRPMLREWLDRELPGMVERMVAAEIGRVSGRA